MLFWMFITNWVAAVLKGLVRCGRAAVGVGKRTRTLGKTNPEKNKTRRRTNMYACKYLYLVFFSMFR